MTSFIVSVNNIMILRLTILISYTVINQIHRILFKVDGYARIFVRGHCLFREAKSFPRAKLEENCVLQGTDNFQGEVSVHIFEAKWRLLCLLSALQLQNKLKNIYSPILAASRDVLRPIAREKIIR